MVEVSALIKSEVVKSALITDGFIADLNAQKNINKCSELPFAKGFLLWCDERFIRLII